MNHLYDIKYPLQWILAFVFGAPLLAIVWDGVWGANASHLTQANIEVLFVFVVFHRHQA